MNPDIYHLMIFFICTGSRFNAVLDRGLIVLEIGYCLAEDSGLYVCVATNALGHTESQPVELR